MLIYNHEKKLIGIDEKDLNFLGFKNLASLKSEFDDFADLFVKRPGFIHNFKHVHWIDFVRIADDVDGTSKVIIEINGKQYQSEIKIESIYLEDEPSLPAHLVYLEDLTELNDDKEDDIFLNTEIETESEVFPNEDLYEQEIDEAEEEIKVVQDKKDSYIFDPNIASQELGLSVELVKEFINDFVKQANEFKYDLYNSLENNDIDNVKKMAHKLKGVSANLRIDNVFKLLSKIRDVNNKEEIKNILDDAYVAIEKLSAKGDNFVIKDVTINELSDDIFLEKTDILDIKTDDEDDILESLEVMYDKKSVADELEISYQNFDELFHDFLIEAKNLVSAINDAILENNKDSWTIEAIKLKGMSKNMHLYDFVNELDNIIQEDDKHNVQRSINKIDSAIKSLSKL
ncbi:MAG: Hpt domain-containing protein [Campylobacterales bacterium]